MRLLKIGGALLIVAALIAGPASAKPKPEELIAVSGSGKGIAPGAPEAVKLHVQAVLAGKGAGFDPGVDFLPAASSVRTINAARRVQWFGCRSVYAWRGYNHWLGYNLFRYYQQISWCSNGFSIYSWGRDRWAEVNGPGWIFHGHVGSSLDGTTTRKEAFTQGDFRACVTWYCEQKIPWVYQWVNVDGGSGYSTGG